MNCPRSDVFLINVRDNSIVSKCSMLMCRSNHAMVMLDGSPIVIGGEANNQPLNTVERYVSSSNEW